MLIILVGCKRAGNNHSPAIPVTGSVVNPIKAATAKMEQKRITNLHEDSVSLQNLIKKCIEIAIDNRNKEYFSGQIDSAEIDYDRRTYYATYQYGNLFSKDRKHLLVKRFINGFETEFYADIFLLSGNDFKKTAVLTSENTGYTSDTIIDVNNDGYKDYIIKYYSNSGCCPRDAWYGYLYSPAKDKFVSISFFNPEFPLGTNEFYESDYGYPGAIKIYKYKWIGLQKVKREELYPTGADGISQPSKPYTFTKVIYPAKKVQVMKDVPEEYKKLEIYKYFISYQD